jgi:hypothetical protein
MSPETFLCAPDYNRKFRHPVYTSASSPKASALPLSHNTMPPIRKHSTPRVVVYHQTHHTREDVPISILPLLTQNTGVTHIIIAAIHLNDPPGNITLNDHPPSHPRFQTLWAEVSVLRATGIPVLGLLGGAAKGSFTRLDLDDSTFEQYYVPLRDMIRTYSLDGLDLDVEEPMSLAGVIRLIDRLKADFGESFIITLAPVAAALMTPDPRANLSGFDYEALEVMRGNKIAWYNTQFYCGWGDISTTAHYDRIIMRGFAPLKVVVGLVTNPGNGAGWVPFEILGEVLLNLRERYGPGFGGVMGWEYFNSLPGDSAEPWKWADFMGKRVGMPRVPPPAVPATQAQIPLAVAGPEAANSGVGAESVDEGQGEAEVPKEFEYFTDTNED